MSRNNSRDARGNNYNYQLMSGGNNQLVKRIIPSLTGKDIGMDKGQIKNTLQVMYWSNWIKHYCAITKWTSKDKQVERFINKLKPAIIHQLFWAGRAFLYTGNNIKDWGLVRVENPTYNRFGQLVSGKAAYIKVALTGVTNSKTEDFQENVKLFDIDDTNCIQFRCNVWNLPFFYDNKLYIDRLADIWIYLGCGIENGVLKTLAVADNYGEKTNDIVKSFWDKSSPIAVITSKANLQISTMGGDKSYIDLFTAFDETENQFYNMYGRRKNTNLKPARVNMDETEQDDAQQNEFEEDFIWWLTQTFTDLKEINPQWDVEVESLYKINKEENAQFKQMSTGQDPERKGEKNEV